MRFLVTFIFLFSFLAGFSQQSFRSDSITQVKIDSLLKIYESQAMDLKHLSQVVQLSGSHLRTGVIVIVTGLLVSAIGTALLAVPNKVPVTTKTGSGNNITYSTTYSNSYSPLSPRQYAGIGLSGFGGALMLGGIIQIGIAGSKMSKLNTDL